MVDVVGSYVDNTVSLDEGIFYIHVFTLSVETVLKLTLFKIELCKNDQHGHRSNVFWGEKYVESSTQFVHYVTISAMSQHRSGNCG